MIREVLKYTAKELCELYGISYQCLSKGYKSGKLIAERSKSGRTVVYKLTRENYLKYKKGLRSYNNGVVFEDDDCIQFDNREPFCISYEDCLRKNAMEDREFSCVDCQKKIVKQF